MYTTDEMQMFLCELKKGALEEIRVALLVHEICITKQQTWAVTELVNTNPCPTCFQYTCMMRFQAPIFLHLILTFFYMYT